MTSFARRGTTALLLVLLPLSASAAAPSGISGPEMVQVMQAEGYQAKLSDDADGDPTIETRMSGVSVHVFFYDCEAKRCGSLQFSVGLDLDAGTTPAVVNKFNREFRYARAYLDDEMDPFLKYDFELPPSDHRTYVASQLGTWEKLLGEFTLATGFRGADATAQPDPGRSTVGRTAFGALTP